MSQWQDIPAKLTPIGKALRASRAARFYHNGDGAGFVWRWWHPVTWVFAPLTFIVACFLEGAPAAWQNRHEVGFGMDPWFRDHPERLEWDSA